MKFYHFGLIFAVIAAGFFVTAQTRLVSSMQQEEIRRNEYDSLVAAVNAAVEVAFIEAENVVTEGKLQQVSEVFFQTLSVLHGGGTDAAQCAEWQECIPILAVFEERGYYRYCFTEEAGYGWSELILYDGEGIPEHFFTETEDILSRYHALHNTARKTYRMEAAQTSVWEKSLTRACVFAVYAPPLTEDWEKEQGTFLYAAAERTIEAYLVTEDNYCHLPSCEECNKKKVVARYSTQKESAMKGARPCEKCLK